MNFILTASGAEYHLDGFEALRPEGRPFLIRDIAHHLSMCNRFTGATTRPYSVAEHSLLVAEIAQTAGEPLIVQLAALLHDGHEAYTQDLSGPAKAAVNRRSLASGPIPVWRDFEAEQANALRRFFGVQTCFTSHARSLHFYDMAALATERRDLMVYDPRRNTPWAVLGEVGARDQVIEPVTWVNLASPERQALAWFEWRSLFMDKFDALMEGIGASPDDPRYRRLA